MFNKTASCGLIWDAAVSKSVDESQRWVLSTMQRHGRELVTMLWRILGNEQDVCDAYQESFLQLAHYQGREKPEHIKAYIFRTATNVAISMIRRKMADRRLSETIAKSTAAPDRPARQSQAANELDARNLQDSLRYYVAELPENLRNVITLRDLAELSYAQVGRILGITAGSARVYRCKALQLLAVWMNNGKARP